MGMPLKEHLIIKKLSKLNPGGKAERQNELLTEWHAREINEMNDWKALWTEITLDTREEIKK
jgi:hypothetical protein